MAKDDFDHHFDSERHVGHQKRPQAFKACFRNRNKHRFVENGWWPNVDADDLPFIALWVRRNLRRFSPVHFRFSAAFSADSEGLEYLDAYPLSYLNDLGRLRYFYQGAIYPAT